MRETSKHRHKTTRSAANGTTRGSDCDHHKSPPNAPAKAPPERVRRRIFRALPGAARVLASMVNACPWRRLGRAAVCCRMRVRS